MSENYESRDAWKGVAGSCIYMEMFIKNLYVDEGLYDVCVVGRPSLGNLSFLGRRPRKRGGWEFGRWEERWRKKEEYKLCFSLKIKCLCVPCSWCEFLGLAIWVFYISCFLNQLSLFVTGRDVSHSPFTLHSSHYLLHSALSSLCPFSPSILSDNPPTSNTSRNSSVTLYTAKHGTN